MPLASVAAGGDAADQQLAMDSIAPPPPQYDWIFEGLRQVIIYLAPHKALAKQKRWMCRFCHKPRDMTIRKYMNHICRINDDELPNLQPFHGKAKKLLIDKVLNIVLNGVPCNWICKIWTSKILILLPRRLLKLLTSANA
jgi:hypothetical protein